MKTIKPSKNYLFARVIKPEEAKTKSGIILPEKAQTRKDNLAEVINNGDDSDLIFEPKSTILYKEFAATSIKLNDEDFILISVFDVLGTILEVE